MRRQKNMFQKKGQNPRKKILNEMEISNLSNKEFKVMVIEMFNEPERGMDELSENLNKEIEKNNNQN